MPDINRSLRAICDAVDADEMLPEVVDPVLFAQASIAMVRAAAARSHKWPSMVVRAYGDGGWPADKVHPEFHDLKREVLW